MKQALLNRDTVVKLTSLRNSVKAQDLAPHMKFENIFNKWFNLDLYEAIVGDLKDYTAEKYSDEATYVVGDYAEECGVVYQLTNVEGNGVVDINCDSNWSKVDLFKSDCLNELKPYLENWLAWQIASEAIPFIHISVSGDGAMVQGSNSRRGQNADETNLNLSRSSYRSSAMDALSLLKLKLAKKYEDDTCGVLQLESSSCRESRINNRENVSFGIEW